MKKTFLLALLSSVVLLTIFPSTASARTQTADRVQFGRDIWVNEGESTGDLVCIVCSIHVRGQGSGDAVAILGGIILENGQIGGDSVAIGGRLRALGSSQIGGDAVSILGGVQRDSDASIGGDTVSLGGPLWFLLIVVFPFALFAAFVTLVVWLIQRLRQPAQPYQPAVPAPPMR